MVEFSSIDMSSIPFPRPGSSASRPTTATSTGTGTGTTTSTKLNGAGILTPAGAATLNRTSTDPGLAGDRKRKRAASIHPPSPTGNVLHDPIVLKPHPATLTSKPHILHPLMLLPRDQLPLSALDLRQPHGDLPTARSFESKIKILDLEGRLGSNVLLARSETTRVAYAVEREAAGLYIVCKLGAWVDLNRLGQGATVICSERMRAPTRPAAPSSSTVQGALTTPFLHKEAKKRRLVIDEIRSMVRSRSFASKEPLSRPSTPGTAEEPVVGSNGATAPSETGIQPSANHAFPGEETPGSQALPSLGDPPAQPTADDIFQNIRSHYFEALYHSMGSLAYFAKGPLSRARAAFHLDCDANLEMGDLIDFLKTLVMTTIVIDKKYRETLPAIIGKLSTADDESDHADAKSKKRKPKKMKLGKDGLYPTEAEHVRRWWATNKPAAVGDDNTTITPTETKYHISCLRRRETQLQMILILEILALEPLRAAPESIEESQLPGLGALSVSCEATQEPVAKKKSRTNLPVLLDVHADRLCIWQTTMSDETKALAESQVLPNGQHAQKADRTSDPLRDFCVDIILPFFSARLPELCETINRKLGGPVAQPQAKERLPRPALPSKPKPGAPAKRPPASARSKEKTLERVLTKERMRRSMTRGPSGTSGTIALLRSASVTTIMPGLKREASEPLLSTIPKGEPGDPKCRPPLFSSGTNLKPADDPKAIKKAQVEAELKDAISALKKPNRVLAVKEFVDAAEKRTLPAHSQPKSKLKKQSRLPSSVTVKATPVNNRFKDVLATTATTTLDSLDENIPSSSCIPASTAPRKFANLLNRNTAAPVDSIQATPARGSRTTTSMFPPSREPARGDPPSSPIMTRKAAPTSAFLSVPKRQSPNLMTSPGGILETPVATRSTAAGVVMATPIKARLFAPAPAPAPVQERRVAETPEKKAKKEVDIYQQLGWDMGDFDDI